MKDFLDKQTNKQRIFYLKTQIIAGIHNDPNIISQKQINKAAEQLTNDQIFDFCRFSSKNSYSTTLDSIIKIFRQRNTGNSCLHVAGEYGNMAMLSYILKNKVVDANLKNNEGDTSLMHTLRTSNSHFFQKSILLLQKFSDLTLLDAQSKRPDQITLASYSKSRARIMQILRQDYISAIKGKS